MAHEVYSFKTVSDQVSLKCISSLLKEGHDLHLEDIQRLEDKIKERNVFAAKLNKTHEKCEVNLTSALQCQVKPKKKLPPLFPTSTEKEIDDLIDF